MKKQTTTLILICFSLISKADYWTQKADFGGAARWAAVGFTIGNNGYIGTGSNGITGEIFYSDFWAYNPLTNIWTQKADFGGTARYAGVGFSINNKGYLGCGGTSISNYVNDFWEYDPATNTWTPKANFGGVARIGSVGFSISNKGYIGTGYDGTNYLKDFWEYDPLVNAWTQKTDFGGTVRFAGIGFSDGTKGYIGVGTDNNSTGKNDFWQWDPNTNIWTQKANFGGAARSEACSFFICPFGYIGMGTTMISLGTVSDFWKYNITSNTWTQAANFGAGLREMATVFTMANKAYVGTGFINDDSTKIDFWEYTPDSACVTGFEEFQVSNFEFHISPNPAKDFIVISYSSHEKENLEITITDIKGKKVLTQPLTSNKRPLTIDIRNFSKGIYFVEASNGKQKEVKKIVKE